jgi:hypothetical protein
LLILDNVDFGYNRFSEHSQHGCDLALGALESRVYFALYNLFIFTVECD